MNINAKIRRFLPLLPALAAALLCCACGNSDSGADAAYEESILAEAMDYDLDPVPGGGEEAEVLTLTLSAAGDCTLGTTQSQSYSGSFTDYYDSYGESWFFDGVRDIFSADDFTLVNLECVLTEETSRVDKTFNLKGKPEYTGILLDGSVEGVSLGNNHTMDYGLQSLCDTEDALAEAGIVYGYNDSTGIFTAENGLTVGVVSANLLDETETQENYIRNGIESLREQGVNLIVACCHWGIEKEYYPTDYQIEAAHRIVDWGADLVVGCHPHVLEGIEYYNGKIICYSMGNFCFGGNRNPSDRNTAIYQQTFTFENGVLTGDLDARIIPCTISSADGSNNFQPAVAEGSTREQILEDMNTWSAPYSGVSFDGDGTLIAQ